MNSNKNTNDIYNILIRSNLNPEGSYDHSMWKTSTKGQVNSIPVLLTSVHEAMHDNLNNSTAYGLMLVILANLVKNDALNKNELIRLVNMSRNSHETYATYCSMLIVAPEKIKSKFISTNYPEYIRYIEQAQFLLRGTDKTHLHLPMIIAFIEVCFQNPKLFEYIDKKKILKIKDKDSPDYRFVQLSKYINKKINRKLIKGFIESHKHPDEAKTFTELKNSEVIIQIGTKPFEEMGKDLSLHIYNTLKNTSQIGFNIMEFDQHLMFLDDLLEHLNGTINEKDNIAPLIKETDVDNISALSQFEIEKLIIRDEKNIAIVTPFSDLKSNEWDKLLMVADGKKYIYIMSRITERFISQYKFLTEDVNWLESNYPDYIEVIAIHQIIDSQLILTFIVLDNVNQIKELDKKKYPIMSNTSMLLIADKGWSKWHSALTKYTTHTILFDLSPSKQLSRSFITYSTVMYECYDIETEDGEYKFLVLVTKDNSSLLNIYFMPCSSVMAILLLEHLSGLGDRYTLINPEKDISHDVEWVLRVQMTRLLEEYDFDFNALTCKYAQRGIKDARFFSHK